MSNLESQSNIPAEKGVWLFVYFDLLAFGALFGTFLYYRSIQPDVFLKSQNALDVNLATLNTLLLLTSSLFVALAVNRARSSHLEELSSKRKIERCLLQGAFVCGLSFCLIKVIEYTNKFEEGFTLITNDFFMFYFVLTGIHAFHVILGLCLLGFLIREVSKTHFDSNSISFMEGSGCFWHLVDFLWVILFPLLYVLN
ncbi:MAG: cytochrome c oxidase subunit 3 [Halieaceae bacterium]|nr:cytochrome c oxidase subunit 3 [Halieaceae bacterium]